MRHWFGLVAFSLATPFFPAAAQPHDDPPIQFQPHDDDIARYRQKSGTDFPLNAYVSNFSENGYLWRLVRYTQVTAVGDKEQWARRPYFVVPHDNEDAAFDTLVAALALYGGTAVAVDTPLRDPVSGQSYRRRYMPPGPAAPAGLLCQPENRADRYCDPNRNFGPQSPRYTSVMLADRQPGQPIIALHTNSPGFDGDGEEGRGNISLLGADNTLRPGAFRGRNSNLYGFTDDDFILIPVRSGTPIMPSSKCGQQLVKMGINVWYEPVLDDAYDGSLSHYMIRYGAGAYYNIEVRSDTASMGAADGHNATTKQTHMLNALMTYCVLLA